VYLPKAKAAKTKVKTKKEAKSEVGEGEGESDDAGQDRPILCGAVYTVFVNTM